MWTIFFSGRPIGCMRSSEPAPTALDRHLRRIFGDDEPTGLGSGWAAGVGSLLGGALGFFAVLCFHVPQLLTAPVLRTRYPVTLLRGALQTVLIASVLWASSTSPAAVASSWD